MGKISQVVVVGMLFMLVVGGLLLAATPANSAPSLLPEVRPTVDPGSGSGGGGGGGNGGGGGAGDSGGPNCGAVSGEVLNWGFGPEANVGLELGNGGWQVATVSGADGRYAFGGLGVGVARLRVLLAPGSQLTPLVEEAAIYLTCDFPTIANLAVYSGSSIEPPATLTMSAPDRLTAESQLPVRLTINNNLPNEITNVIVTDLMPPGLIALDAQAAAASPENIRIIDGGAAGQMVVVYLDRLAAGSEANIIITVAAAPDVPNGAQISNSATLFYRESVADQARLEFTVGSPGVAPAVVTAPTPAATAAPPVEAEPTTSPTTEPALPAAAAPEAEGEEEFVPPPDNVPTTGEEFVPPSLMPTTGDEALPPPAFLPETGLGLLLPLSGIGLLGLAFLAHLWRTSNRRHD